MTFRDRVFVLEPLQPRILYVISVSVARSPYLFGPGDETDFEAALQADNGLDAPFYVSVTATLSRDTVYGNADDFLVGTSGSEDVWYGRRTVRATVTSSWPTGDLYLIFTVNNTSERTTGPIGSATPIVFIAKDPLPDGPVYGTTGNDRINVHQNSKNLVVMKNGALFYADATTRPTMIIDGLAGDDRIYAGNVQTTRMFITGSEGNDRIEGGDADDELSGSYGIDHVYGEDGNDFILGGAHNDVLSGGGGDDTLIGSHGHDRLSDYIGHDQLIGGPGNDYFDARDAEWGGASDTLSGGTGTDTGLWELLSTRGYPDDLVSSVETRL